MSWSVWIVAIPEAGAPTRDTVALVFAAIDRMDEDSPNYPQWEGAEVKEQLEAACAALDELIASGAVGKGPFTANLSGHANPGHEHREGFAAESVTVTLVNATPTGQPMATSASAL